MMHIAEGILTPAVLGTGALLAVGGVAVGLRKMDHDQIPKVALVSASFFIASLIHIPFGVSSVHLILNGLAGIILGWSIFPAFMIALFLQAILFQFGGVTVLGVNTVNLALPGVLSYYLFRAVLQWRSRRIVLFLFGAGAAMIALAFSAGLMALALYTTGKEFLGIAGLIVGAHIPVMVIEGVITGFIVVFINKVKPELLQGR
jgi:cobalt/nickel transport system permease protein